MPSVDKTRQYDCLPPSSPPTMSMHVYPFPNALLPAQQPLRQKRRQVKNACTHCQKACKKCDDARPCLRCIKYGYSEECISSTRKERKKGLKRGPYKKRDGRGRAGNNINFVSVSQPGLVLEDNVQPIPATYIPLPYPGFYAQYPGDAPPPPSAYTTPYYAVPPGSPHPIPPSEAQTYSAHGFYQPGLAPAPYAPQYPTIRPDGATPRDQYPVYPDPAYQNPSSSIPNGRTSKPRKK